MAATALIALAACDTPVGTEIARATAREAVADVVEDRFPGVPVTPVTDCIIDNASGTEIVTIASEAALGAPGPRTVETVAAILRRQGTVTCLVERAGPRLIAALEAT